MGKTAHLTVSQVCDKWFAENEKRFKPVTVAKFSRQINQYFKPYFGDLPMEQLNTERVERFTDSLLNTHKLSAATATDILRALNLVVQYAERPDIVVAFPKAERKRAPLLTYEQQDRLIKYLSESDNRIKLGILLAITTNIKVGELCAMRCRDVSFGERRINVVSTMQRVSGLDGETKTKIVITPLKYEKTVLLSPSVCALCKRLLTENPDAFLVSGETDKIYEPRLIQINLSRIGEELGIESLSFNLIRDTFATGCIDVGLDLRQVG